MEGDFTGAPTCYCIPTRVGSKYVYYEESSGQKVTLAVQDKGQNEVAISGKLPSGKEISFQLRHDKTTGDPFNEFLLWVIKADTGSGVALTFGSQGLALPMHLIVGNTISATPDQSNPATSNRMLVTYHIDKFERIHVRPELQLDQENGILTAPCIKTSLIVKDEKLGTKLASFEIWLLPGFGVVRSGGQAFGVSTVLDLIELHMPP
jgi:hypothetical protein